MKMFNTRKNLNGGEIPYAANDRVFSSMPAVWLTKLIRSNFLNFNKAIDTVEYHESERYGKARFSSVCNVESLFHGSNFIFDI